MADDRTVWLLGDLERHLNSLSMDPFSVEIEDCHVSIEFSWTDKVDKAPDRSNSRIGIFATSRQYPGEKVAYAYLYSSLFASGEPIEGYISRGFDDFDHRLLTLETIAVVPWAREKRIGLAMLEATRKYVSAQGKILCANPTVTTGDGTIAGALRHGFRLLTEDERQYYAKALDDEFINQALLYNGFQPRSHSFGGTPQYRCEDDFIALMQMSRKDRIGLLRRFYTHKAIAANFEGNRRSISTMLVDQNYMLPTPTLE